MGSFYWKISLHSTLISTLSIIGGVTRGKTSVKPSRDPENFRTMHKKNSETILVEYMVKLQDSNLRPLQLFVAKRGTPEDYYTFFYVKINFVWPELSRFFATEQLLFWYFATELMLKIPKWSPFTILAKWDCWKTPHFSFEPRFSETVYKNLASISHFRQTCQIMAGQTFLADSVVSCKIFACRDILSKNFARKRLKIEKKSAKNFREITENVQIFVLFKTKNMFKMNVNMRMSGKWSRAELNVTEVVETWLVYFRTTFFGSCTFAPMIT